MENRVRESEDTPGMSVQGYTCRMSGSLEGKVLWHKYYSVIARYSTTFYYNDQDMRAGTVRIVTAKDVEKLTLKGWNSLRCHPDFGGQTYCCGYKGRAERHHDASWAKVSYLPNSHWQQAFLCRYIITAYYCARCLQFSQLVDLRANTRRQDALFRSESSYGQLQLFVEFTWEDERMIVAIIQPWEGDAWIPIPEPPMRLTRGLGLQAIDVRNMLAPAGRVFLPKRKVYVAFDTSEGGIDPELVDDQETA
jgi:hypothetical protein